MIKKMLQCLCSSAISVINSVHASCMFQRFHKVLQSIGVPISTLHKKNDLGDFDFVRVVENNNALLETLKGVSVNLNPLQ